MAKPSKDYGPGLPGGSSWGIAGERFTSADQSAAVASVTDAPASGEYLVITDFIVSVDTAMTVNFSEETSVDYVLTLYMPANGSVQVTPRAKIKLLVADKQLQVRTSASGNIAITAGYYSEA